MPTGYPILLDLTNRLAAVIGGGPVAARKVKGLLAAGVRRVRVVSYTFHPDLLGFPEVECIQSNYDPAHLSGAALVFAATNDPAVNAEVVRDARRIGALVNRADVDEDDQSTAGDFVVPAAFHRGPLTVSISTGGNPGLSAKIRDAVSAALDPAWVQLAEVMAELRPTIKATLPGDRRRALFKRLATDDEPIRLLRERGVDAMKRWVVERIDELA